MPDCSSWQLPSLCCTNMHFVVSPAKEMVYFRELAREGQKSHCLLWMLSPKLQGQYLRCNFNLPSSCDIQLFFLSSPPIHKELLPFPQPQAVPYWHISSHLLSSSLFLLETFVLPHDVLRREGGFCCHVLMWRWYHSPDSILNMSSLCACGKAISILWC